MVPDDSRHFYLELPSNLPKSPLWDMDETMKRTMYIYERYVCEGSVLQVNISHDCRTQLDEFMLQNIYCRFHSSLTPRSLSPRKSRRRKIHFPSEESNTETSHQKSDEKLSSDELYHIFDLSCTAVLCVLLNAFTRFCETDVCIQNCVIISFQI